MKALLALGIFVMLTGAGLLYLSRVGVNLTSSTDVNTYKVVKSKAHSKIHIEVSPIPGYVALGGGFICVAIGLWGIKKKIP